MTAPELAEGYQNVRDTTSAVLNPMGEAINSGLDWLLTPIVWPLLELLGVGAGVAA